MYQGGNVFLSNVMSLDISVTSPSVYGSNISFSYQTTGNPGSFEVSVYQSADDNWSVDSAKPFDPNPPSGTVDKWLADQTITAAATGTGSLTLSKYFPYDPQRPYILVVADPRTPLPNRTRTTTRGSAGVVLARIKSAQHHFPALGNLPAMWSGTRIHCHCGCLSGAESPGRSS